MSGTYDGQGEDELAHEGVQAFNAMAATMHGLSTRMGTLDSGLGAKVIAAERAASSVAAAASRTEAAATAARETALAGARSSALWTACLVAACVLVAGSTAYLLGERAGETVGQANGYQAAQDEKAAASWANTPSGRLAFAMDQLGSLNLVGACAGQGWTTQTVQGRRMCYPRALKDGSLYGWALP